MPNIAVQYIDYQFNTSFCIHVLQNMPFLFYIILLWLSIIYQMPWCWFLCLKEFSSVCCIHDLYPGFFFFPFMFRIKGRSLIYPPPAPTRFSFDRLQVGDNCLLSILPKASANKDVEQWITTDTRQWEQPPLLTPIKSMSSDPLCVQLYIEHPSLSEPKP